MAMSPAELSALADHYWTTREQRLAADKVAAELKTEESRAEALLIQEMRANNLTAVGGQKVRLSIPTVPDMVPTVTDWEALRAHILKTGDFSLLEKRVGKAAVKERWDADVDIPGVVGYPVFKLSKSKV